VRLQFSGGQWADFYVRRLENTAQLYRIVGSDGSISEDPGVLKIAVAMMIGNACGRRAPSSAKPD
jgi:hypothetical protein